MHLKKLTEKSNEIMILEKINEEAIPSNERTSLYDLFATGGDGGLEITGIIENGDPIGFYALRKYKNVIYIAYFAVRRDMRSRGIGSKALSALKDEYKGRRIVVEYERPDNDETKIRRKNFYLKNGFYETGWYNSYDEAEFEIACSEREFDISEFECFIDHLNTIIPIRIPKPYKK